MNKWRGSHPPIKCMNGLKHIYDLFSNATIESNSNRLTLYNHVLDYL